LRPDIPGFGRFPDRRDVSRPARLVEGGAGQEKNHAQRNLLLLRAYDLLRT
jgi:hypothetical protein